MLISRRTIQSAFFATSLLIGGAVTSKKPASSPVKNIVLVHGAFADGSSWSKVIPCFKRTDFT